MSEWDAANKGLNEGLTKLLITLKNEKASINSKESNTAWKPNWKAAEQRSAKRIWVVTANQGLPSLISEYSISSQVVGNE